ncbi:TIGR04141 family sporadically distributed protein [Sphingomonas sp. NIBR02145]|uniref:TIGR04141 family sporadically distributed protein n=1 Tax=Sphingomonas sp. NIBR02145 TaxID=3014784 RepID=UPI0022B5986D|nr:TIGR04141 family sporadically distributed protein [Sphingomonas sp. NIBR02145]WHU01022.1 TIGR04141 family sporadically distributed protein [Sphingomonas sp. NIBR02145]
MTKKTLTLYLGKEDINSYEEVFTEESLLKIGRPTTQIVTDENFGDGARLYVFVGDEHVPTWLREVRGHFMVPGNISTSAAAGVLLFWSSGRLFASTFAHGWMYLDEHRFEGDFGLRAAINALDDTKLKRLERANLGDALRGVALSPFQRGLTSFGLDDALDLIRKISGRTRDDASAESMTGSRSLRVTGEFGLDDLPDLASDALDYYESDAYQQTQFAILDSVMPVADKQLSEDLDDLAADSIRAGETRFEFGLPIGFDDVAVSYKFAGPGMRGAHPDLLLRHYVASMGGRLADLTAQTLRDHRIIAKFDDDARPDAKWPVRTALVGSLVHENERYAINEGEWYRIEQGFKDAIEEGFSDLIEDWDEQPEPLRKIYNEDGDGHYESEADYNARLAQNPRYLLLDRALISIPGVDRSAFESCDILDIAGKRFIHIKKSSRRSSVLSHFFKQGANSARHFSMFEAAWVRLRELVVERAGEAAGEALDNARQNEEHPWKVEFFIADTPRENGDFNIPFFSKVSLRDEVRTLRAMRYETALRFINLQPD